MKTDYQGWDPEYYYISDYLHEKLIGAKVTDVKGGCKNKYRGEIHFDNGMIICFHEDSEGPTIYLEERR